MSKEIRVAIVGCGKAGHMHARAIASSKHCILVAVHSRDLEKARSAGKLYNAKGYAELGEMITTEKIDAAIICTPHPEHSKAIHAMEGGAHILVEKPLASSLEDCNAILEASQRLNKKVGVVSQRRFYPATQRARNAIQSGKIGKPMLGTIQLLGWRDENYYKSDGWRGTWKDEGGGVLVNQAPHQLDIFQWLMEDDIHELYGIWKNINHPYIEVDDTALAVVKFKNGAIGNILVSNSQKPGLFGKIHIHGSNGASVGVQTDGGAMFIAGMSAILEPPVNDLWSVPGEEFQLEKWKQEDIIFFNSIDPVSHFIQLQIDDFAEAILNNREPEVSGKEGRKTVEIFTAIYQSARSNSVVQFPL